MQSLICVYCCFITDKHTRFISCFFCVCYVKASRSTVSGCKLPQYLVSIIWLNLKEVKVPLKNVPVEWKLCSYYWSPWASTPPAVWSHRCWEQKMWETSRLLFDNETWKSKNPKIFFFHLLWDYDQAKTNFSPMGWLNSDSKFTGLTTSCGNELKKRKSKYWD